jgi:plastocyanin
MTRTRGAQDIRRLASVAFTSLVCIILGAESIRAATIQIDGVIVNSQVRWTVGGAPAASVAVNPGDTVIWRAVTGRHGVVFDTQAAAEGVLQFEAGGGLPPLGRQNVDGETVWGTAPQNPVGSGTVLARATVKSGVAPNTQLGFFCSQHGRMMNGALAVVGVPTTPPPGGTPPPPGKMPPVPGKMPPVPGKMPPVPGKQLPAPGKYLPAPR